MYVLHFLEKTFRNRTRMKWGGGNYDEILCLRWSRYRNTLAAGAGMGLLPATVIGIGVGSGARQSSQNEDGSSAGSMGKSRGCAYFLLVYQVCRISLMLLGAIFAQRVRCKYQND